MAKNSMPILEHDTDPTSVVTPDHEHLPMVLPRKAVFAFLGSAVDRYAIEHDAPIISYFVSATKDYPVYLLDVDGQKVCLVQAPVGAPAAAQILDWLIAYGVREIISGGSCGALTDLPEGMFLIPSRALRDEGTSYHYLPPERFIDVSGIAQAAIEKAVKARGLTYGKVVTWSTDGFFRETKEKVAYRKREGCSVVEMECSALAACAKLRGAVWGELLFTADTLADAGNYDARDWGGDSKELALALCIEAVMNI
ncbi:MAG: nucleoside phosphorylase [Clostridia bacterium]|nr:nucleoside phosphorylase [Clostridia bacterium]